MGGIVSPTICPDARSTEGPGCAALRRSGGGRKKASDILRRRFYGRCCSSAGMHAPVSSLWHEPNPAGLLELEGLGVRPCVWDGVGDSVGNPLTSGDRSAMVHRIPIC